MREAHAALEVAVRFRYVVPLSAELVQRIAHVTGTLVKLSFPRQAS